MHDDDVKEGLKGLAVLIGCLLLIGTAIVLSNVFS